MLTATDLNKLLNAALEACKKATGDVAEEGRAVDALNVLAQQLVTTQLLTETQAGKRLKKLSKHESTKVAQASQGAIDAWKECIRKEQASKGPTKTTSASQQPSASGRESSLGPSLGGSQSQPASSLQGATSLERAPSNKIIIEPAKTGDETRDKIRKLLGEALALALGDDVFGDPNVVAVEVEEALFKQNAGVTAKYKAKFRSLSFNLKDPKNPELRAKVLNGEIPGDVLVTLSAEEMASSDMRAKNDSIREYLKKEAVRGQTNQASTDMFQCGKCKQRKCTYYQMQTRSADEPMTTFVTCTNCGNRWKFC